MVNASSTSKQPTTTPPLHFHLTAWTCSSPRSRGGRYLIVWLLIIVSSFFQTCQRPVASAIDGGIICNRIPGLVPEQRKQCRSYPDAMAAVGVGANLGLEECQFQFRYNRWNCSLAKDAEGPLQLVPTIGSRETAFSFAIRSAGVTYAITKACSQGELSSCGCDKSKSSKSPTSRSPPTSAASSLDPDGEWKWGGCSANIDYGLRFGRSFLDAMETEQDPKGFRLMNRHNNRVGRKALKENMARSCKCSGTSGSCTTRICWTTLPHFRSVGDHLALVYGRARMVVPILGTRAMKAVFLKLKRSVVPQRKPRWSELVYLHKSPDYCDHDPAVGSLGTRGRQCNRTSVGTDGCEHMCCGRGFDARVQMITTRCRCKFHWCCFVTCEECSELLEECRCR